MGAPVATALLVFRTAGVPAPIVELPFAFSFATADLLCVALRGMKAEVAPHQTRRTNNSVGGTSIEIWSILTTLAGKKALTIKLCKHSI
jgi:hypothetical protein